MPYLRPVLFIFCLACFAGSWLMSYADEPMPKKYALLIGVSRYEHAGMNRPQPLEFPEEDAKALAELLAESGYKTLVLVGEDAKRARIVKELAQLKLEANDAGNILVGFFGHGVEYRRKSNGHEPAESYFCPYDVNLRVAKDSQGRTLYTEGKLEMVEPDPETAVGMTEVFNALQLSKAGRRIVLADCCRNDPNAARGRSFGANVNVNDLPERTAALFACSSGEKAFEDKASGHGVFTQAVLERIREHKGDSPLTAGSLGEHLELDVPERVSKLTKGREKQTPRYLTLGRVDLQLAGSKRNPAAKRPLLPVQPPLFNFADAGKDQTQARAAQQAWANYLGKEVAFTNAIGMEFVLTPPGEFMMGTLQTKELTEGTPREDEFAHRVRLTRPIYCGVAEVTQGQWFAILNSPPWKKEPLDFIREGAENPAVMMTWQESKEFCETLSAIDGKTYRLPTEAEWEYLCRAGTETAVHCKQPVMFHQFAWFKKNAWDVDEKFAHSIKQKAPNYFGIFDMHGNVAEYCEDFYSAGYYHVSPIENPTGANVGDKRVIRGGSFAHDFSESRSARRLKPSRNKDATIGFRVVIEISW